MRAYIGCCGFPVSRKKYFASLRVVELQQTFYKLPRPETAVKWREEAPEDFIFTMKIWQVITHPPSSPTWRKAGIKVDDESKKLYGFFKPTEENIQAWEKTIEIARAVKARILVAQTPPSFGYSKENENNMIKFFEKVKRDSFTIGWEPRGDWRKYPEKVLNLVTRLNLIHVVDPFRWWPPVKITATIYLRLHGIGGKETNYSYKYTIKDFDNLCGMLLELSNSNVDEVYIMFNNKYMFQDALSFKKYLEERRCGVEEIL